MRTARSRAAACGAMVGAVLVAGAAAMGQPVVVRLLPTEGAQPVKYGITALSAEGRSAVGWQFYSVTGTAPAAWNLDDPGQLALRSRDRGAATAMAAARERFVGHEYDAGAIGSAWRSTSAGGTEAFPFLSDQPGHLLRTLWSGSRELDRVLGCAQLPAVGSPVRMAVVDQSGVAVVAPGVTGSPSMVMAGNGMVCYFAGSTSGSLPTTIYRWDLSSGGPPVEIAPLMGGYTCFLTGCSFDGSRVFLGDQGGTRRYIHGVGVEAVDVPAHVRIQAVTPDGTRGVGRIISGPQQNQAVVWEPVTGIRLLAEIADGVEVCRSTLTISDDGGTIAGTMGEISQNYAFFVRLNLGRPGPDFTRDGVFDQADLGEMLALLDGAPNPYALPLDVNRDGEENFDDFMAAVHVIAGGGE